MVTQVIGVTGSIGSGKSTFSRFLAAGGGAHLDADKIARDLIVYGQEGYAPVVDEFGTDILDEKGYIQPGKLADEVFSDKQKLRRLEEILHPLVEKEVKKAISKPKREFYVIDAPLLFEAEFDKLCDWVVVVTAPCEVVEKRLKKDSLPLEDVKRRRRMQMAVEEKIKRADQVVDNSGTEAKLKEKAVQLLKRIKNNQFAAKD